MKLSKSKGGAVFRKIAMGSWSTAADPSVYGLLEIDMTNCLNYLEKINQTSDVKVGLSEIVGRATALVLKQRPEMNGLIRFGRIYLRHSVDLFYQVNVPAKEGDGIGKANLMGLVIRNSENKSVVEIAKELKSRAAAIKSGEKNEMAKSVKVLSYVPWRMMKFVLNLTSFLTYDLRFPVKYFGLQKDPFGSVMITNVGGMGVETAWAPLVPYTRVPLLLTMGALREKPWVVDGRVEVRKIMRICCTFDHRFMDGVHAAHMCRLFEKYFNNPELME